MKRAEVRGRGDGARSRGTDTRHSPEVITSPLGAFGAKAAEEGSAIGRRCLQHGKCVNKQERVVKTRMVRSKSSSRLPQRATELVLLWTNAGREGESRRQRRGVVRKKKHCQLAAGN